MFLNRTISCHTLVVPRHPLGIEVNLRINCLRSLRVRTSDVAYGWLCLWEGICSVVLFVLLMLMAVEKGGIVCGRFKWNRGTYPSMGSGIFSFLRGELCPSNA